MEDGSLFVVYHQRLWPVAAGCIRIDRAPYAGEEIEPGWSLLVQNLLPLELPPQAHACSQLLKTCFEGILPHSVIQAAVSLTSLKFEQQARALLTDVLKEHREAASLYPLLQGQLLLRDRSERTTAPDDFIILPEAEQWSPIEWHQAEDEDWDWAASPDEVEAPDIDDSALRTAAADLQGRIGAHRPEETGAKALDFEEDVNTAIFQIPPEHAGDPLSNDRLIVERVATLGSAALDVLKYFADNPGDKTFHAESILGYPVSDINRLVLGSLRHYLKKSGSGWECQPWLIDILAGIDETHDEM
jgi:hypothetical protein